MAFSDCHQGASSAAARGEEGGSVRCLDNSLKHGDVLGKHGRSTPGT